MEWQPIESAPKDNLRPLYLAKFDSDGNLLELDFDGSWEYWEESWELSHINGYYWASTNGIQEPTHWAYQDKLAPSVDKNEHEKTTHNCVLDHAGNIKNFLIRVGGKNFRCQCGCNVFHKPDVTKPNVFKCNGCDTQFEAEPEEKYVRNNY